MSALHTFPKSVCGWEDVYQQALCQKQCVIHCMMYNQTGVQPNTCKYILTTELPRNVPGGESYLGWEVGDRAVEDKGG